MKKILVTSVLLITCAVFTACKKDFLNLAPNEFISEEQAFGTMIQTENFANNIYTGIPAPIQRIIGDGLEGLDCLSDEGATTFNQNARVFNGGGYGPSNITSFFQNIWANSYFNIRKVNILLNKLPTVPVTAANQSQAQEDEQTRKRLRGEALFLRSFFYFDILKVYGRFPIIDKPLLADDEFKIPRNSYNECVSFIQKDLDEAITILKDFARPSNEVFLGRANAAMCMALKSRLLLYAASPLNNTDDPTRWQAAAKAAKDLIDLNAFSLYNDKTDKIANYKDVFNVYANKEIIWFVNNLGNSKQLEQLYYPVALGGWGNVTPTQNLVDEYQMANGKDITDPTSGYDPAKPYLNREPRFYATVWYNGSVVRGITIQTDPKGTDAINGGNNNTRTGYYMRKYCNENINLSSGPGRQIMGIWFRLAEFYLNYAEASNEANGSPDADPLIYTYVNLIRDRAGLPPLTTGLSKEQMRLAIRHERRVELSFEEHRFFDDRRWKLTFGGDIKGIFWDDAAGTSYTIKTVENRPFSEKIWYMPIPQSEIDITKIQQNPGW